MTEIDRSTDTIILVPTYQNGEFSEPHVPVYVDGTVDGISLGLGDTRPFNAPKPEEGWKPNIQVERHKHGWCIFLHPEGGGDPSGYVFLTDDGRSFLVPEEPPGSDHQIAVVESPEGYRKLSYLLEHGDGNETRPGEVRKGD